MGNKQFAERLNRELDIIGIPSHTKERVGAFAKSFRLPRFKAENFLNGFTVPADNSLIYALAEELEVNAEWLLGKSEHRQRSKTN